jgi:hypothetical protein
MISSLALIFSFKIIIQMNQLIPLSFLPEAVSNTTSLVVFNIDMSWLYIRR